METWIFEAIGTEWQINLPKMDVPEESILKRKIEERIGIFDKTYSRFRADSLVTSMSHRSGTYELPADAEPLLELYYSLYDLTGGAMTPLVGQLLSDAGYDASYSLQEKVLTKPKPLEQVITYTSPRLTLHQPALLDFGAAGKGYLVDIIAEIIEQDSSSPYTVDAGGDMRIRADEPVRVGLEHPDNPSVVIGIASVTKGSICGSAGNRRAWGKYHHVMDPHTLSSPTHIKALWVTSDTTLVADALTTALFFAAPETLRERYTFEYAIMRPDDSIEVSKDFPAEIFT